MFCNGNAAEPVATLTVKPLLFGIGIPTIPPVDDNAV
jgi:hypothetical protein